VEYDDGLIACASDELVRHWFNFDVDRSHKPVALVLDVGRHVRPTITPDDPQHAVGVLRRHGIQVSEPA
jgi:hypothetical protein